MTRVLNGFYRQTLPGQPPAPFLTGDAIYGDNHQEVHFMIDTGADITVLSPEDAEDLFGETAHSRLGDLFPDNRVFLAGVGQGEAVEVPMTLAFRVPNEPPIVFRHFVLVMAPPQSATMSPLPSLLGRDILNRFVLLLNPAIESVELTELDATPSG